MTSSYNLLSANKKNENDDRTDDHEENESESVFVDDTSHTGSQPLGEDGNSSTTKSTSFSGGNKTMSESEEEKLAQRETRHVLCLRLLVCFILIPAASMVCYGIYYIAARSEQEQFELQFIGAASKVTDAFLGIANERLGYAGALVVALVTHAIDNRENYGVDSWPFVTLSSFQERASSVKEQAGFLSIGINPIVQRKDRRAWENYTMNHPDALRYYNSSLEYAAKTGLLELDNRLPLETEDENLDLNTHGGIAANHIYDLARFQGSKAKVSPGKARYLPAWLLSPVTTQRAMVNQDRSSNSEGLRLCLLRDQVVFEGLQHSRPGYGFDKDPYTSEIAWLLGMADQEATLYLGDLFSTVYLPLYDSFADDRNTVGVMRLIIHWARFFRNILPPSLNGVVFVLENTCSEPYTYVLNGPQVEPLGVGDLHNPKYDYLEQRADFRNVSHISDGTTAGMSLYQDSCPITIRVYPSQDMEAAFRTNTPAIITVSVAIVFAFATAMFFVYDRLVEHRQQLILRKAEQTNAIVTSLFPKTVRDRLMEESNQKDQGGGRGKKMKKLKSTLSFSGIAGIPGIPMIGGGVVDLSERDTASGMTAAPIADLFPEATVMFADIAGFTAWSSSRDPGQVFFLLQSIYQSFDKLAAKRNVFKVETIGDSYVAVTGCPHPQSRHALIMARFAGECMRAMRSIVQGLYTELGPDTADLRMRFGMHSGPVTAGVLMGDRARFQLFGDTVNTASRMESTGIPDRIQASKASADLLIGYGKTEWVSKREDAVKAKGKGTLLTYWIDPRGAQGRPSCTSTSNRSTPVEAIPRGSLSTSSSKDRQSRLVDWMTELFKSYVKDVVAKREVTPQRRSRSLILNTGGAPLDEVVDVIELPEFDPKALAALTRDGKSLVLDESISTLLREYVALIASLYNDNPFHNFEHACHVAMAADKFLKRIVAPSIDTVDGANDAKEMASILHDYCHGIHSDSITLFAIVFSALIHDVGHTGVSNGQLAKENKELADLYKNKSVAEQNSLDVAWSHLMSERFSKLRNYIFASESDLARFREVVVNVVLATDIFDKELNDLRKSRWTRAFTEDSTSLSKTAKNGLRATIVIEHIIQASDVCHTMQHWHVYRKWNRALFNEMSCAYREGRMSMDPAKFWYKGEIGFFDNYIIPLAKKLKDCQVFGVSSDECLNYALLNRDEWMMRGEQIVAEMVDELNDRDEFKDE